MLSLILTLAKIIATVIGLIVMVVLYTYAERKVIGFIQNRIGPNRVGPLGLLQPIADVVKLLLKEIIRPQRANKLLFFIAPMVTLVPALAAWAVLPFEVGAVIADINVGLVYVLALTSLGVYGVIIAGWATNSRYAFLGAVRSAAQIISYEIPMGFALLGVIIYAGSMNLTAIVEHQAGNILHWNWLPLLPLFVVYWISAVAETNRAPFDVAEGESEIVAGFHVEYSAVPFAIFFLAEYINMILVSFLAAILFMGGWHSPVDFLAQYIPGQIWLVAKTVCFMFLFLWFRATFPRFRYDQIMRLGWKIFIPVTLVWIVVEALAIAYI